MGRKKDNLNAMLAMPEASARRLVEKWRWPNGPVCPHCGSVTVTRLEGESTRDGVFKCKDCRKQFTVTVGTFMERSHIPITKWVQAIYLFCTARKGVSALQLQRILQLASYKSAWHMVHRVREAMKQEPMASKLKGTVEIDEAYVGGKPRPKAGAPRSKRGRGTNKQPVFVMVERDGEARCQPVNSVREKTLVPIIKENVDPNAVVMTDEWKAYRNLCDHFPNGHGVVQHGLGQYVAGNETTNTAESFWAIVKRSHKGVYHKMSKKHMHRYCTEYEFRWNTRKLGIELVMEDVIQGGDGKRLMFKELTRA
jgi:transposase-like protein